MSKRPASEPGKREVHGTRRTLLSLYLPAFVLALGTGVATPALPVFAHSFGVSFGVAALVVIVHVVGSAAATVPTGYLVDRFGRRKVILAGPLITALTSFLIATADSFPELLIYRFVGGWASQMWLLGRLAAIADSQEGRRGRQITGLFAMDTAGRLLGPAFGGLAAAVWDVRVPFILHGVIALLAVLPSYKLLRESAPQYEPRPPVMGASSSMGWSSPKRVAALLATPLAILFIAQLLVSLARGALHGGTLYLYAVYAYGVGPETIGIVAVVAGSVAIPLTLGAGHALDRWGRKVVVVPGFALLATGLAFLAATAYLRLPFEALFAALLTVQMAQGATAGSMQTLSADLAPPHARGSFLGAWRLTGEVGHMLSPSAFAILAEVATFSAAFLFLTLMAASATLLLAAQVNETVQARPRVGTAPGA